MITIFEKFNWWKKPKNAPKLKFKDVIYSLNEPLTAFMNELDGLKELEIQRAVCRFINDKLINSPKVTFNAVDITNDNHYASIDNKEYYDEHKEKFSFQFDGRLNPMIGDMFLITLSYRYSPYSPRITDWKIFSFLIHIEDLKNMLVDKEIKYTRLISTEDPYGEEDWD